MTDPPRTPLRRKQDALHRLERDIDAWVATAAPDGAAPHLVPLSFLWDGAGLLVATHRATRTGRNLQAGRPVRVGVGPTRDVVMIDGTVAEVVAASDLPAETGDAFAAKTGFEPRALRGYAFHHVRPDRVQSWREADEIDGRDLMRDGRWIAVDTTGLGRPRRPDCTFRQASGSDAADAAALVDAAYRPYIPRLGMHPGPMLDDYGEVISRGGVTLVDRAGALAGLIVLDVTADGFLIENVSVHPAHQGAGLGRDLMSLAERAARHAGFDAIHLFTHEGMTENIALYAHLGYREFDRRSHGSFALVYMRRAL